MPLGSYEQYGTTVDTSVDLYWYKHTPPTGTRWPVVLLLHPGGYKTGAADPQGGSIGDELALAGFLTFGVEYRLAVTGLTSSMYHPPHPSTAQNEAADNGHYPKQTTDVQMAIIAARALPECDGRVYCIGGSAGGSHALYMAATGTAGDDMPDLAVMMSCGVSNLADANLWSYTNPGDETWPADAIANYLGITNTCPAAPTGADLTTAQTASPVTYFHTEMPPLFVMMSNKDSLGIPTSTGIEADSYTQLGQILRHESAVENGIIPSLNALGWTKATTNVPAVAKYAETIVPVNGHSHAFEYWSRPVNGGTVGTTTGQYITTWLLAGPPAPGGSGEVLRGVTVGISNNKAIDPAILADPNVDCIGINVHWNQFEPSENNYDFDRFVPFIQQIAAAGKKAQLTVTTQKGSENFDGNTPSWVFTAIGNTAAGNPGSLADGVTTNLSAVVTSATGNFSDADLYRAISGTNIPGSSYIGLVNSATSISLSSSPVSNVAATATGSGTAITLTISGRHCADGVTTISSPTVTSATAGFRAADLHLSISGTGIPPNSFIGVVNSATSIGLSSSNLSNHPINATATGSSLTLTLGGRPRVSPTTNSVVYGCTYTYNDKNPNNDVGELTFIVFYEPTYLAKVRKMITAWGNEMTNGTLLTAAEKACIAVVRVAYAASVTDDWAVPYGLDPSDHNINWTTQWLGDTTGLVYNSRGHGYTTQKMIDTAITNRGPVSTDQSFTDGQTFTNTRLVSATANFTFADVGQPVTGTNIPTATKILSWTSATEVTLDKATTGTGSSLSFLIKHRAVGIFDVAAAAFPGCLIETAIGAQGPDLDADAAAAAGDSDVSNFLPRSVAVLYNANYPNRIVTTKNQLTAITPLAPPTGTGDFTTSWRLLYDISTFGLIAAQDLGPCNDSNYRMNGGTASDKDNPEGPDLTFEQISDRASSHFFSYTGALYREIYATDALALPGATKFAHDLFTGGTIIEPPPPPPDPTAAGTLSLVISAVSPNYKEGVRDQIADLLNIDVTKALSSSRARRWASLLNRHVAYAWRFYKWPELELVEERAFAPIWNDATIYSAGYRVYWLGETVDDVVTPAGYYTALIDTVEGVSPADNTTWETYTLTSMDYFIPILQGCRRRIGDIQGVYPVDPRTAPLNYSLRSLNWNLSNRGVEVYGSGQTTFVHYRAVPYRYSNDLWSTGTAYEGGNLVLWDDDGEVYRALQPVSGIAPSDSAYWSFVPFPSYLADYAIYMTAADDSDSKDIAEGYRETANEYLCRGVDTIYNQKLTPSYNFGLRSTAFLPLGTSGFMWSITAPFTDDSSAASTISPTCLTEWGDSAP